MRDAQLRAGCPSMAHVNLNLAASRQAICSSCPTEVRSGLTDALLTDGLNDPFEPFARGGIQ